MREDEGAEAELPHLNTSMRDKNRNRCCRTSAVPIGKAEGRCVHHNVKSFGFNTLHVEAVAPQHLSRSRGFHEGHELAGRLFIF